MKLLKSFFDFYLNASVHVGFSVIALLLTTILLLGIEFNYELAGFIFFGTIVCYNFVKYGVEAEKYLIVSSSYHKSIQIFSFACFVPAIYFFTLLDTQIWISIIILALLSALYAVPLLPKNKNLRSLGGLKIYIVALVWVGFTVFLPVIGQRIPFSWDIAILGLQRFILVLILLLPFEIRDIKWDNPELKTLPQVMGIKKTKRLGIVLTAIWFLLTFLRDELRQIEVWPRLVIAVLLNVVFLYGKNMQKSYLVSFWVESIPIFWCGMVLLLTSG
ncbi:hypothetical protein [Flagellimonas sp.]|uniref:hypothetical protein n=1 Tax=Flagellimonas sp. TaxID=2058762 RepID=UPI003B50801D